GTRDSRDREAYYRRYGTADHALADYSETIRRDPNNAQAYLRGGAGFARRGEPEKAVADFTAALRSDPENTLVYYNRALAYSQKNSYDQALADFTKTLFLDPRNVLAYFDRGLLHSRHAAHDLAIADFDQALRLDDHDASPNHKRGHIEKGMEESAKLDYAKLLVPDPAYAAAYNSLAWVWATSPDAGRGDGKKAVEYATKACELT